MSEPLTKADILEIIDSRLREFLQCVVVRQGDLHIDENKRTVFLSETLNKMKDSLNEVIR